MPRVLLLYATPRSGHAQAAHGLKQAFEDAGGFNAEEYHLLLKWPRLEKFLSRSYQWLVKRTPGLWGHFHGNRSYASLVRAVAWLMYKFDIGSYLATVRQYKPDVIVCTHILPLHILGEAYRHNKIMNARHTAPLLIVAPTDLWAHRYWYHPAADHFFVATERAAQDLRRARAPEDKITVTGIPLRREFSDIPPRQEAESRLMLPSFPTGSSKKTVLVMGGSYGLLPITQVIKQVIDDPRLNCHRWLFLCGMDADAYHAAQALAQSRPDLDLHAYQFRKDMVNFMAASDLYLTKAGGLSSSESLVCGLPLLFYKPLPGQERVNANLLVRAGAAREAYSVRGLVRELDSLLSDPRALGEMRKRALRIAHPDAGRQIVNSVRRSLASARSGEKSRAIDAKASIR